MRSQIIEVANKMGILERVKELQERLQKFKASLLSMKPRNEEQSEMGQETQEEQNWNQNH